ncbi:MAG: EFR1 family ferrodoxin [Candidatus Omnitrophota bacterium]
MSTAIYYFSATGNSLKVARDLAKRFGDVKLIPVTKALKDDSGQFFDIVGIVYPVYMFGLPLIIRKFLKQIKFKSDAYIFSVATLGGLPGRAHSLAKNILAQRGYKLALGFSVLMPGNYTPLYGAIAQEKQDKVFEEEEGRIQFIAENILARKRGIIEEKPALANFLLYKLLYRGGMAQVPLSGKNFWVNEACIKCGLCAKVCPVNNVELVEGKPKWLDHCQQCMACLQWCPVEAIQYKKNTVGRKRYHHPAITVGDIMEQKI